MEEQKRRPRQIKFFEAERSSDGAAFADELATEGCWINDGVVGQTDGG